MRQSVEATNATESLALFFRSHYDEYFDEMIEALDRPGRFHGREAVVQGLRDLVHGISDTFLDARSPRHFGVAVRDLNVFVSLLGQQRAVARDLRRHFDVRGEAFPRTAECLHAMIDEISDALGQALGLGEPAEPLTVTPARSGRA